MPAFTYLCMFTILKSRHKMAEIKLWIRGVFFAVNPHYKTAKESKEVMEQRTIERLKDLDERRPEIILIPEPDNAYDHKAIRAWCEGSPIGYVAAEETSEVHPVFTPSCEMVEVTIEKVEVKERGNIRVKLDVPEKVLLKCLRTQKTEDEWKNWTCDMINLPCPDEWKGCKVCEYAIGKMMTNPKEEDIGKLTIYLTAWMKNSLHDLSMEAGKKRRQYMTWLQNSGDERLKTLARKLGKQNTALCSDRQMEERMEWWNLLLESEQMEHFWDEWRSKCKENDCWTDLQKVDACLRKLPGGMYANVGDLPLMFSALHYRNDVPRRILWSIYSLLLLRQRICAELNIPMKPLPENAYEVKSEETDRAVELTDERLARAVEECQGDFWACSSWAVVFCVCRDYYGTPNNMSAFERRIAQLTFNKRVWECPKGTICKTISNNDFMTREIGNWKNKRTLKLAMNLKDCIDNSFL